MDKQIRNKRKGEKTTDINMKTSKTGKKTEQKTNKRERTKL